MRAVVYRRYGSPDGVRVEDVDIPEPGPDELRIRVRAASVNPADSYVLRGQPYMLRLRAGLRRPNNHGLGLDFAGVVDAIGDAVTAFRPGDEVFGAMTDLFAGRTRTFAEYLCVPAAHAARMPAGLSFDEAATLPVAGCTALYAVRDYGEVRTGQRVLINGAGGGVGVHAVQFAKHFGATVTAVCSEEKAALVRGLGADRVIDYRRQDFTAEDIRYDVIIDLVSNHSAKRCGRALAPEGRFVWVGAVESSALFGPLRPALNVLAMPLVDRERRWVMVSKTSTAEDLATLAGLLAQGAFRPVIGRRYPLADVADAIRYLEEGHACGKVVITV